MEKLGIGKNTSGIMLAGRPSHFDTGCSFNIQETFERRSFAVASLPHRYWCNSQFCLIRRTLCITIDNSDLSERHSFHFNTLWLLVCVYVLKQKVVLTNSNTAKERKRNKQNKTVPYCIGIPQCRAVSTKQGALTDGRKAPLLISSDQRTVCLWFLLSHCQQSAYIVV